MRRVHARKKVALINASQRIPTNLKELTVQPSEITEDRSRQRNIFCTPVHRMIQGLYLYWSPAVTVLL